MAFSGFRFTNPKGEGEFIKSEPVVTNNGDSFTLNGPLFDLTVKKDPVSSDWLQVQSDNVSISFEPFRLRWKLESGNQLIANPVSVPHTVIQNTTQILGFNKAKTRGLAWLDVFGSGIHMGVAATAEVMKKIIKIDSLNALGEIPATATHLEIIFKINTSESLGEWNKINEHVFSTAQKIGSGHEVISQPKAWDSNDNYTNLDGIFAQVNDQLYFSKRIPINLLNAATFPVFTDAEFSYDSASVFIHGGNCILPQIEVLDFENQIFLCQRINSNNVLAKAVRYNGGNSFTIGSDNESTLRTSNNGPVVGTKKDSNLNKWVWFSRNQNDGNDPNLIVGTHTDPVTWGWGSLQKRDTTDSARMKSAYLEDDKLFLFEWITTGTTHIQGSVVTFSGDTATWGTPTDLVNISNINDNWVVRIAADKVLCLWEDDTGGQLSIKGAVATISGTTVTWGSVNTLIEFTTDTANSGLEAISAYDWYEDADYANLAVMIYADDDETLDYPKVVGLAVSEDTNTISVGTPVTIAEVTADFVHIDLAGPIQAFISYNDTTNSNPMVALADITWGSIPTISVNTPEDVGQSASTLGVVSARYADGKVMFYMQDSSNVDGRMRAATYEQKTPGGFQVFGDEAFIS